MRRRLLLVCALVLLTALAGCNALQFGAQEATGPGTVDDSLAADPSVSDPPRDVQGWEGGFWANESLAVTPEDGLNRSELDAVVARGMARVELVRGVEFDRPVDVSLMNRSEYRDSLEEGGSGAEPTAAQDAAAAQQAAKYEALFLVGESTDAGKQESQNRASTVQGFYSVREDRIVLISESETPRMNEVTLAQELFHAYQFRHALRQTPFPRNATQDQVTGLISLVEGDANFVDALYERRCESRWDCLGDTPAGSGSDGGRSGGDRGDDSANRSAASSDVHMGLYILSYFPYAEGEELVRDVYDDEGWRGVDKLYGDPPLSSRAVIHQRIGEHPPEDVAVPPRRSGSWERVGGEGRTGVTVGEAGVATMFAYTLYDDRQGSLVTREQFLNTDANGAVNATSPLSYDLPPSAGWAGDRLVAYENADRRAYVWRTAWDSPAEAREFADAYRELLRYHGAEKAGANRYVVDSGPFADAFAVGVDGSRVTVVNAPDEAALSRLSSSAANDYGTSNSTG
ncbi:Hvo_1808 family surface protein [Haloarchaeobius sp. TZWWS8]|uniref:Hvo_1808 family surface protein n=1 Tax=Haloarchaeobius sp. TZWWS8 TaxID=3446121 RepID=UPI003EC0CF4A